MAEKDLSRPQMFLFGCVLKSDKKEYKVEVDDDEADHQLSLKAVCLGAEAEDKLHTVEIEGVTYDGKTTKIPLAVLKPSVLPSLSLGGFEITPPFTFRLQSGAGPVYISGQHFVILFRMHITTVTCIVSSPIGGLGMKDSDDEEEEEENNTSPVKRPTNMATGKVPLAPEKKKSADKQNGSPGKKDDKPGKPQSQITPVAVYVYSMIDEANLHTLTTFLRAADRFSWLVYSQVAIKGKDKVGAGPSGKTPSKLSISEIKNRLATAVKEGKPFPKTDQKFENYAKNALKITDKQTSPRECKESDHMEWVVTRSREDEERERKCLHFLVLYFQLQESHQSSADFRFYIENHTRDDVSRKQVRIYQLYSRTTGKHVQILGKKINANGDDGGKYALLVVETETFGSHIRIKGKESGYYICMNKNGKIIGKLNGSNPECVFVEEFLENNYTALVSAKYKGWYLGFNRQGRPKKGSRTTQTQQEVHFMKRDPKGKVDPQEEFRFTTVTKRTRRARRLRPNRKTN
ncbi:Fibroblast growth factor 18 [Bagarius yarrelli]|uniref:Fibroblast growth factor n=1 Tax=Bagarius yarrelli TaxID=175774 RepID=A0A556V7N2_BAGYA|nr:Fibroblast growth factor 18 [Bagarius yarrelli]